MLEIKKTTVNTGIPIWQKRPETLQGGFTVDDAGFVAGDTIPGGTPIYVDEQTRKATIARVAVLTEAATNVATQLKVKKGSLLKVTASVKAKTAAAQAITAIDKTNADYDLVTVGTTLGIALAIGDALFVDNAAYTNPKGLSYEDVTIGGNGIASVSCAVRGTVYARRIVPVPQTIRALLPLIYFSESY